MSKPKLPTSRTTNWHVYNAALARRGSLSIWFDPGKQWLAASIGKPGRQPVFTDAAIQACPTLKALFGLPLRQTTELVARVLHLGELDWPGAGFQPSLPPSEDPDRPHSLPPRHRRSSPADRQHRCEGRRRWRVAGQEARAVQATGLAQGSPRVDEGQKTVQWGLLKKSEVSDSLC